MWWTATLEAAQVPPLGAQCRPDAPMQAIIQPATQRAQRRLPVASQAAGRWLQRSTSLGSLQRSGPRTALCSSPLPIPRCNEVTCKGQTVVVAWRAIMLHKPNPHH